VDKNRLRLALNSVTKNGENNEPQKPYTFEYYLGTDNGIDMVPPRNTISQDYYGYDNNYPNGPLYNTYLAEQLNPTDIKAFLWNTTTPPYYMSSVRDVSVGRAKNGILKTVKLPTDGIIEYTYEQNDCNYNGVNKYYGGVRVKNVKVYKDVSDLSPTVEEYEYKDESGLSSGWGYEDNINFRDFGLLDVSSTSTLYKGQQIVNSTIIMAVQTSFKYNFGLLLPNVNPIASIASALFIKLLTSFIPSPATTNNSFFKVYSFYPNWISNPIGLHYSRVSVKNTSLSNGNGKVIYEFTKPNTTDILANDYPHSAKQRTNIWKYDLPSKTIWFNQTNLKVREVENIYSYIERTNNLSTDFISGKVLANAYLSANVATYDYNTLSVNSLSSEFYYPKSGRTELAEVKERNYVDNTVAEQSTKYFYNTDYLVSKVEKTRSNGDLDIVKNYYTNDFTNSIVGVQVLSQNGIDKLLIQENWLKKKNTTQEKLKNAAINYYGIDVNNRIVLQKNYKFETSEPVAENIVGQMNPTTLVRNTNYFKEASNFFYDSKGNVIQKTDIEEQRIASFIIDDTYQAPVAQIFNAANLEVAYTSFESTNQGKWTYNIQSVKEDYSVTGKKYFSFPTNVSETISSTITANKNYRLSYWSKNGSISIGGLVAVLQKTGPTVLGWTYYEYKLPAQAIPTTISLTGTGSVDELRLYPENARMNSVTYCIWGKTSECDENNRISYFEYDALGRLINIKDQSRNLLKSYKYNVKY
jgi:hypothetical protein